MNETECDVRELVALLVARWRSGRAGWTRRELHEVTGYSHEYIGSLFALAQVRHWLRYLPRQPRGYALTREGLDVVRQRGGSTKPDVLPSTFFEAVEHQGVI